MTKNIKNNGISFILYLICSYPLFYFVYKFYIPDLGGNDFYAYYLLYEKWDFENMSCPFNMRLIGSFFIFLMNKAGLHYDTEIAFYNLYPEYSKQVFFNAVFFNYLCVLSTCFVIYKTILRTEINSLFAFISGMLFLFGFGTVFFALSPNSDACGILLLAIVFYYYQQKNNLIYIVLTISLFQREYIFIVIAIVAIVEFYYQRKKYDLTVFIFSCLLFIVYIVLRKTFFYTPTFLYQLSPENYWQSILYPKIEWLPYFRQTFMISNLLILYLVIIVYKKINGFAFNVTYLLIVFALVSQMIFMSIAGGLGNNAGRYFYMTAPIIIFYLSAEIKPMLSSYLFFKEDV